MQNHYILDVCEGHLPLSVGNKARSLRALMEKGFPVPRAYVITWEAYEQYLQNNTDLIPRLSQELHRVVQPGQRYAVRSSANIEDSLFYSFAGQFKSALNISGADAIFQMVWSIWATASSDQVKAYLDNLPSGQRELKMGVILQEMVPAVVSGVAFSKNPINGLDEIVIEAVCGTGVALVQGGSTPDRWIYKNGGWLTQPEDDTISEQVIQSVVHLVQKVAVTFQRDVDVEWVYDGSRVNLVQMRDITTLTSVNVYSNAISKDMMSGVIKPLIWSVNIPLVVGAKVSFIGEVTGDHHVDPLSLVKSFYYRTYFNMTALGRIFNRVGLPGEALEMMLGVSKGGARMPKVKMDAKMLPLLPRLVAVMWDKWHFDHKIRRDMPGIEAESRTFSQENAGRLSISELLREIHRLYALAQRLIYFNFISQVLMSLYSGILRGQFKKRGLDFERLDLMRGVQELEQYDPIDHLQYLSRMYHQLDEATQSKICACSYAEFYTLPGIGEFQQAVEEYLRHFGHLSDNGNDFSTQPWREDPCLMLQIIASYQEMENRAGEASYSFEQVPLKAMDRLALGIIYRRARLFRLRREQFSFLYTYVYGMFRPYYLALGDAFCRAGLLASRDDIFFLSAEEVRRVAEQPETGRDLWLLVDQRRAELESVRDVTLPTLIYGDQAPPVVGLSGQRLTGTPSSRGCFTGPVRVVRGLQDFNKVQNGDVLVVPYSDVGWTPLFARAGGVVAESGGMLSHSSIIAREYNIPAVVSVEGATQLEDNTIVTVDGFTGEVLIHLDGSGSAGQRLAEHGLIKE